MLQLNITTYTRDDSTYDITVSTERWCRLRGNLLFYFKSRDHFSEPAGTWNIWDAVFLYSCGWDLQTDLRHVSCVYSPCTQCLNSSFSPVLLRCDCDRIVSNRGGWSGSFSFRQCAGLRDNTQVRKRWESTNLLHGLFTHLHTILTRALVKDDVKNSTAFYLKEFVVSPEEVTVAAIYDVLTKSG